MTELERLAQEAGRVEVVYVPENVEHPFTLTCPDMTKLMADVQVTGGKVELTLHEHGAVVEETAAYLRRLLALPECDYRRKPRRLLGR